MSGCGPLCAVLWDFDGTLVDTRARNLQVNRRIIGEITGRPWAEETFLVVFRDREDRVQSLEINAFTARLVALLEPGTLTGRAALETVAAESRHPDPARVVQAGTALLDDLRGRGAILGTAT